MLLLKGLLVVLHILVAVGWMALSTRLQTLARIAELPQARAAGDATVRGMTVMALLLPLLGLGAMFAGGGFAAYGPVYHMSVTLALVLAGVQLFGINRVWKGLAADGRPAKMAMWMGLAHLTWLVILVLMLWPQYLRPALL